MPERSRPSALLSDFGGVLTTDIWGSFEAFLKERGLEPSAVRSLFRKSPQALQDLRLMEIGRIEPSEFERRFAALLGIEPEGLIEGLFAGLAPDPQMVGALRRARSAGIPTGLLSNSWVMEHYTPEIRELFDAVVISAEVGLHKPQPEIFLLASQRVGVEPGRCVFVDDLRENCAGAEAVGMTAILHRDAAQTVARLEALFGITLA